MTHEMEAMGTGAAAVVLLTVIGSRKNYLSRVDAMGCAAVLFAIWSYSAAMEAMFPAPTPPPFLPRGGQWLDPIADGLGCAFVVWRAFSQPRPWKVVLSGLLFGSVLVDCALASWVLINHETTRGLLMAQGWVSNGLFWLALATIVGGVAQDAPILARAWDVLRRHRRARPAHRAPLDAP